MKVKDVLKHFFDYSRQYGTKIKIIRIFNTYGPRMQPDDGRVVSNFIVQALKGSDITIYGDGKQTRSFCYIDDLVKGILKMREKGKEFSGPVNLGNPNEFEVLELAKIILKLTNSNSKIVFKKLPNDDPKQRKPSIDLAFKKLNWKPEIQIERGLKKTIKYFEGLLKI